MSKKTLILGLAPIFFFALGARAVTYNMALSVGGNSTDFPVASKGFLIVDPAGDGFDFVTDNSTLLGKSDSKANEKWGDDDIVVFAGLQTVDFPNQGRGFNIPPTQISTDKWKSGDKLALVWFPGGVSTAGSKFSYYSSDQVDHESGTISFQSSKNGATDSIVALGVQPKFTGIIASTSGSSGGVAPSGVGGGSSQVQKSKKGDSKGKSSSAKKSSGSKKSSAKKSSGSKKSSAKKSKGSKKSKGNKKAKK